MNSNQNISKQVKYIPYWMSDLQPTLTSRYLSSLRSLLSYKLSLSELSLVVKAAILLINKTRYNKEEQHPVLELAESLLSGFISCYTEYYSKPDHNTVLQEINSQVTELLLHCCQEPSSRNSLVVKLSGSLISVVTNSNLEHWLRISWLKSLNTMLMGSSHSQKSNILKEHVKDLELIVDFLFHCGDYDTQTCLVEFLLRYYTLYCINYLIVFTAFQSRLLISTNTDLYLFNSRFVIFCSFCPNMHTVDSIQDRMCCYIRSNVKLNTSPVSK